MKMKKLLVSTALVATVVGAGLTLSSCGNSGIEVYEVHTSWGTAEYNNMHKTLVLLDNDTYAINVLVTDTQDETKTTMDFQMIGEYSREGDVVTIEYGAGHVFAMNGDNVAMDNDLVAATAAGMYALAFGPSTTITLDGDTFTVAEA